MLLQNQKRQLDEAGYLVVRWNSKAKPDANAIRQRLLALRLVEGQSRSLGVT